jgi:photosystem II stability/assembly factor-like uncharacterized protein
MGTWWVPVVPSLKPMMVEKHGEPRSFSNLDAEEEVTYRFQVVSFKDGEGWVLGKPTLLLHTKDSGKS